MKKVYIALAVLTMIFLSACSSTPQTYKTEYTRKITVESNEPCVKKHDCTPTLISGFNEQASSSGVNNSYDSRQDAEIAHLRERLEDERLARMNDRITDTRASRSAYNHDDDCRCEQLGQRGRHYHDGDQ